MFKKYIEAIVDLLRMHEEKREYFLSKANPNPVQIQVLPGLRAQESLLSTVRA